MRSLASSPSCDAYWIFRASFCLAALCRLASLLHLYIPFCVTSFRLVLGCRFSWRGRCDGRSAQSRPPCEYAWPLDGSNVRCKPNSDPRRARVNDDGLRCWSLLLGGQEERQIVRLCNIVSRLPPSLTSSSSSSCPLPSSSSSYASALRLFLLDEAPPVLVPFASILPATDWRSVFRNEDETSAGVAGASVANQKRGSVLANELVSRVERAHTWC